MMQLRNGLLTPLVLGTAICGAGALSASAGEGAVSAWSKGFNSEARLVAGRPVPGAPLHAGVQLKFPAGWKTYWRMPGDAGGIPPEFDWSGSENLSTAEVLYPAPERLIDKAGNTIGYKDEVTFPVAVTAKDAAAPVVLKLKAAYGICKDICIPAETELELTVPPDVGPSAIVADALEKVPRSKAEAGKDPTLVATRIDKTDGKAVLTLEVADGAGGEGDAFIEGPAGIFVPVPERVSSQDGRTTYRADITESIADLSGKEIRVTMTAPAGQSEATFTLQP